MEQRRLDYIDGLRGFAALMIIVVHSENFVESGELPEMILSWLKLGRYGVQIFYIISGFTIMMSIERQKNSGGGTLIFTLEGFFEYFLYIGLR